MKLFQKNISFGRQWCSIAVVGPTNLFCKWELIILPFHSLPSICCAISHLTHKWFWNLHWSDAIYLADSFGLTKFWTPWFYWKENWRPPLENFFLEVSNWEKWKMKDFWQLALVGTAAHLETMSGRRYCHQSPKSLNTVFFFRSNLNLDILYLISRSFKILLKENASNTWVNQIPKRSSLSRATYAIWKMERKHFNWWIVLCWGIM